jgi:hypothetical protein
MRVGPDDLGGEQRLERIGRMQRGDRRHRRCVAVGACLRGVGYGRRQAGAERGEDLAGNGRREIGKGLHGGMPVG